MAAGVKKPYVGQAPILDETPVATDWGQLVRHIGPIDAVIVGGGITFAYPSTATVAKIPTAIVSTVLAAADATRQGLTIYNDSKKDLYVRVDTGPATTDNWTVKLRKDDYYELPFPAYTGEVTGIWAAADATGSARVTAFTP